MKKLSLIFPVMIAIVYLSCTNQAASTAGSSDNEKKNLAADSAVGHAFETGDASKIDSVVAADFVDHSERGDKNRDSLKVFIKMAHDSFPDMKVETIRRVAKDDFVYSWMKFTGNSNGAFGMPKGPFEWVAMEVTRFNNENKGVEHWEFMEAQSNAKYMQQMMQQMMQRYGGGNMEMKKDTAAKK